MTQSPGLVWGASDWLTASVSISLALFAILATGYFRASASLGVKLLAISLKAAGILILAFCLLEPLFSGRRAKPGANQFILLADNSQSMSLKDASSDKTRGDQLKKLTAEESPWRIQLGRDFDVRQFAFDTQLRSEETFAGLPFDGRASNLGAALDRLVTRFQGRPLAGIILLTDGSATDTEAVDRFLARAATPAATNSSDSASPIPPIYPVVIATPSPLTDISLDRVSVSQTNFEDAPVTLTAEITSTGMRGHTLLVELSDESGKSLEIQKVPAEEEPIAVRFNLRPEKPGLSFYRVRVAEEGGKDNGLAVFDHPENSPEATLVNNTRVVPVDRGNGPYRVLYVSGRPNWEFKFLQRAIISDDQTQLTGLIRIAKREPKFDFMGNSNDSANPLFRGFMNKDRDDAEQYDQPVFVRLGTADQTELKGGFPKTAEELFTYHAIILDDVESDFFSQDQQQLLKDFVRFRGGGLLMLGGAESFKAGKYDKTPIGDLLPVYTDQIPDVPPDVHYRLSLSREGWLEPWLRLHTEEDADRRRLEAMPAFTSINQIRAIKPGATVLARAVGDSGPPVPAIVEQHFGKGRSAALLIGDLWRWGMQRPIDTQNDLEKAWRQTVRWLVADVPQRVELAVEPAKNPDDPEGASTLTVQVRDPAYSPLDNAQVTLHITTPDQKTLDLHAEPSPHAPGSYQALYVPRLPGAYRAVATALTADNQKVGEAHAGWTSDPAADEFKNLQPDTALLERLAHATGGQVVTAADLPAFARDLPSKHAPITEPYIQPFWHQPWVFLLAIACLAGEWGLRRWKGLP